MTRLRFARLGVLCLLGLLFLTCSLQPALAQTGNPMCFDSTRMAYFPKATRVGDTLITAKRTATTVCEKPLRPTILVRAGATDTMVTQPGATLTVEIKVEPGVAAFQATLGYATTRLTLNDPTTGNARMQWVQPWSGAINPTSREFNVLSPLGNTTTATVARAYFTVRATTGRTNVTITAPNVAVDASGNSVASRIIVRNLVVCVVSC